MNDFYDFWELIPIPDYLKPVVATAVAGLVTFGLFSNHMANLDERKVRARKRGGIDTPAQKVIRFRNELTGELI